MLLIQPNKLISIVSDTTRQHCRGLIYSRDRLKREKLLEDARNKEAMQRHRVVEFLEKLDREREAADGKRKV